jgi:hypothetical protein
MAVVVARAHRDHRDARVDRSEEGRVGIGAAMVRHLQDVGSQVDPGVE